MIFKIKIISFNFFYFCVDGYYIVFIIFDIIKNFINIEFDYVNRNNVICLGVQKIKKKDVKLYVVNFIIFNFWGV